VWWITSSSIINVMSVTYRLQLPGGKKWEMMHQVRHDQNTNQNIKTERVYVSGSEPTTEQSFETVRNTQMGGVYVLKSVRRVGYERVGHNKWDNLITFDLYINEHARFTKHHYIRTAKAYERFEPPQA
jgi:hypothetical protein